MKVPLLDLAPQVNALRDELLNAVTEVMDSQKFIMGQQVGELEEELAAYCQSKHAIGVSSGSDALLLALMALEIGPGDGVITSPYTFFATGGAIARLGAIPVFCDIESVTYNLCPAQVARYLDEECEKRGDALFDREREVQIKAIIPVHLYGQTADMDGLMSLAAEHKLAVIEDAAQAIGAETATGQRAGSVGDIGCYSFFPSKNLGAFGDGGMCVTSDEALNERMRVLRVHGGKPKYYHQFIGGNFRLDTIHAAVLRVKHPHLDSWTEARQANAARYNENLQDVADRGCIRLPVAVQGGRHIYNQYIIRTAHRDALREHLTNAGIGTEIYYPIPLHLQDCFSYLDQAKGSFPEAESAALETLAVPIYPELTTQQIDYVSDAIHQFLSKAA